MIRIIFLLLLTLLGSCAVQEYRQQQDQEPIEDYGWQPPVEAERMEYADGESLSLKDVAPELFEKPHEVE